MAKDRNLLAASRCTNCGTVTLFFPGKTVPCSGCGILGLIFIGALEYMPAVPEEEQEEG